MKIIISYIGFKISGQPTSLNEKVYNEENKEEYEKIKLSLHNDFGIKIGPRTGRLSKTSKKITIGELLNIKNSGTYFLKESFDTEHYVNAFGKSKELVIRINEF